MAYIGRQLSAGNYLKLDDISSQFNGTKKTFNLTSGGNTYYPGSAFSILVSLGGVVQEPDSAYQIDQNTITFAAAPQSTDDFFCISLGEALGIGVPGDGTVTGSKFAKPFNYDNGLLYLDDTNDRVGIKSTTPGYTLDVNGDINFNGTFYQNGSQFVASRWTAGAGTTIYRSSSVGIGSTQPAYTLDVGGDINFSGTFYQNKSPFVASRWSAGAGTTIYRDSSVGIGTTQPSEKLEVAQGNILVTDGAVLTDQNINVNVSIGTGKNGLLIGPVTVGLGVTIDVASGSTLVIV
jgi:hypothetical protein